MILANPDGATWRSALRFAFRASNNEAEYEALIAGLRLAKGIGAGRVQAFSDSQLVVNHLKGEYEAKEPSMVKYLAKAQEAIAALEEFEIERIPREENVEANALAKLASSEHVVSSGTVCVEVLHRPSTEEEPKQILPAEVGPSWMDPIVDYIRDGKLPESKKEVRKLIGKSSKYSWIDGKLYRRSFTQPYFRCLRSPEAEYALGEIYEGACGNHLGGGALAQKAIWQGYYWPKMMEEASEYVWKCDRCQKNANEPPTTCGASNSDEQPLAFCPMGNGPSRPILAGLGVEEVSGRSGGLLH